MTVAVTALYPPDIGILESSRQCLNERLINVGQAMIKTKCPHLAGLQDVGRRDICTFEEEEVKNCANIEYTCHTLAGFA